MSLMREEVVRTEVAEWEEPRHSGPIGMSAQYPTLPHPATHLPTKCTFGPIPGHWHSRDLALQSGLRAAAGRGTPARKRRRFACMAVDCMQDCMQRWELNAGLRGGQAPIRPLPVSSRAAARAAATSNSTDGTSSRATTSCILGPARAASS